jgi:hypothetical protein
MVLIDKCSRELNQLTKAIIGAVATDGGATPAISIFICRAGIYSPGSRAQKCRAQSNKN